MSETDQAPATDAAAAPKAAPVPTATPFAFNFHGSRAAVIDEVKAMKTPGKNSDQSQIENAKAFILSEIAALPADVKGVKVTAEGNLHTGARQVNIIVSPDKSLVF